ncbi:hypothetical protein IW261DRAFT_1458219 [Armillaria novae-zelandiae]|uniref:O-methyltransferase n=1 Tax=Armillaria novae-zelandiae TaxID=153914 RepID=A0AA39UMC9_9AGAR|nr:hypothetical protein IW261DRAFT_1458219 [Armillaria novae-zelandiae]
MPKDDVLHATVQNSDAHGLRTEISVNAALGKFLNLVAKSIGAKRILEIGTLAGYSTISLARALPKDGKVTSLELHKLNAKVISGGHYPAFKVLFQPTSPRKILRSLG